jgi:hypothetical protein
MTQEDTNGNYWLMRILLTGRYARLSVSPMGPDRSASAQVTFHDDDIVIIIMCFGEALVAPGQNAPHDIVAVQPLQDWASGWQSHRLRAHCPLRVMGHLDANITS